MTRSTGGSSRLVASEEELSGAVVQPLLGGVVRHGVAADEREPVRLQERLSPRGGIVVPLRLGGEPLGRSAPRRRPRLGVEPVERLDRRARRLRVEPVEGVGAELEPLQEPGPAVLERSLVRSRSFVDDGDDARPAGARALELEGEGRHGEAGRPRQRLQVGEALDLAVLLLAAEKVALPELRLPRDGVRDHHVERPVEPPGVDPDQLDAAVDEELGRVAAEAGVAALVARLLEVGARPDEDDVERPQLVPDPLELGLDVRPGDPGRAVCVPEVEPDAGAVAPLERDLVDRPRVPGDGGPVVERARRRGCPSGS